MPPPTLTADDDDVPVKAAEPTATLPVTCGGATVSTLFSVSTTAGVATTEDDDELSSIVVVLLVFFNKFLPNGTCVLTSTV